MSCYLATHVLAAIALLAERRCILISCLVLFRIENLSKELHQSLRTFGLHSSSHSTSFPGVPK